MDLPAGTKSVPDMPEGDCHAWVCDGTGDATFEEDGSDTQDDNNPCSFDTCTDGSPTHPPAPQGTDCGGGKICDGSGYCCTPVTCAQAGAQCGMVFDGCGGMLDCGGCVAPEWCSDQHQCGCTPNAQQGPYLATVATNDASIGNRLWEDLGAIDPNDSQYVQVPSMSGNDVSSYLKTTGLGFSVPSFATVTGFHVNYRRGALSGTGISDHAVRIVKGGAVKAQDKSSPNVWSTDENFYGYGDTNDLWGESWTPADVNSPDFGAALSVEYAGAGNDWARVDWVYVTVFFTVQCQ
jgi:hypothetical protein